MLKFEKIYNQETGQVWLSKNMKDIICVCNDEVDMYLYYVDQQGKEITIDEPIGNLRFDGIKLDNYRGTWGSIEFLYNSEDGFLILLEHEQLGDRTCYIIINLEGEIILDEAWDGFESYEEMLDCQYLEEKYNKGGEKKMRIFYDIETRTNITEEELHDEFLEL